MNAMPVHEFLTTLDERRFDAFAAVRPRYSVPIQPLPHDRVTLDRAAVLEMCGELTENQAARQLFASSDSILPVRPERWVVESAAVALGCDHARLIKQDGRERKPSPPRRQPVRSYEPRTCECGYTAQHPPGLASHQRGCAAHRLARELAESTCEDCGKQRVEVRLLWNVDVGRARRVCSECGSGAQYR